MIALVGIADEVNESSIGAGVEQIKRTVLRMVINHHNLREVLLAEQAIERKEQATEQPACIEVGDDTRHLMLARRRWLRCGPQGSSHFRTPGHYSLAASR